MSAPAASRSKAHGKMTTSLGGALVAQMSSSSSSRKKVTAASLAKSISKLGKRTKEDDDIDKWASAKRRKDVPMSAEHRQYFCKTGEQLRAKVACSSGDASHKCSIVALEKWRKTCSDPYACPTCGATTEATLTARLRYLDANQYLEVVPYLNTAEFTAASAASSHKASDWVSLSPELFWNSKKHP